MRVEISNLSFESDGKTYFHDLNLTFEKTKFIGITSPTKSDRLDFLMDMIFGLYLPTKGSVQWNGKDIYYNAQLRNNCYYISSRWMPPLFLRVCDYINFKNLPESVRDLLEKNDIAPKTKLKHLNSRQFFSIYCAQAIAAKPQLICIDFFGANFRSSDEPWVFAQLAELKKHSIVILKMDSTSKNISFCDELYFFEGGQVSHTLERAEAQEQYVICESEDELPSPWLKLPGMGIRHIARRTEVDESKFELQTANLEDVTKLYLWENYQNGTLKKAS